MKVPREEIGRKILHTISGTLIPGGILFVPQWVPLLPWLPQDIHARYYPPIILAAITMVFLLVEILRLRHDTLGGLFHKGFGAMLREEESRKLTGATYIFASSLICSVVFVNRPEVSAVCLSTFIWGDAAAALVGQAIGRIKIGKKTVEGSAACLLLCLVMYFAVFPAVPGLSAAWGGSPILAVVGALTVTVMELLPIRIGTFEINDNLSAPVVTGLVLVALQRLL